MVDTRPGSKRTPTRSAGTHDGVLELGGGHRGDGERAGAHHRAESRVLQRQVVLVGPQGGHDPQDVLRPGGMGQQVGEAVPGARRRAPGSTAPRTGRRPAPAARPGPTRSRATATRPPGVRRRAPMVASSSTVATRRSAASSSTSGSVPGTIDTTSAPRRRNSGTTPACTSELLPDPDGPTTVTNGSAADPLDQAGSPARPGRRTRRRRPPGTSAGPCRG